MHVVILCDSKFGNTKHLAEAMQTALSRNHDVELRAPADGLPKRGDRCPARRRADACPRRLAATQDDALPRCRRARSREPRTATFDTRIDMAKILTGSAAVSAAKLLKRAGAISS